MAHWLHTNYCSAGFRRRNKWLIFEPHLEKLQQLRRRVEADCPGLPAGGWDLLLALRHYVHSKLVHDSDRRAEQSARVIATQLPEPNLGLAKGHVLCEAWWEEEGRWVLMDSQMDAHWESGGRPLSGLEVHDMVVAGRVDALDWVFAPTIPGADLPSRGKMQHWARYFTHVIFTPTGDYLSRPTSQGPRQRVTYLDPRVPPQFEFEGSPMPLRLESDPAAVWFACNRVALHVEGVEFLAEGKARLSLRLEHTAPWFDRYQVDVTGPGQVEQDGDRLTWTLEQGEHHLTVRTVNAMGRQGKESALGFLYANPETMAKAL